MGRIKCVSYVFEVMSKRQVILLFVRLFLTHIESINTWGDVDTPRRDGMLAPFGCIPAMR